MDIGASLAQTPMPRGRRATPSCRQSGFVFINLSYHWRRLRARLHRARVTVRGRGWRHLLARIGETPPGTPGPVHTPSLGGPAPGDGPRVLLVDVTTPRPDRDSGSMRATNLMRLLLADGYRVDFLPDDRTDAGGYRLALQAMGVRVLHDAGPYPHWLASHGGDYAAVIVSRYHLAEFLFPLLRRLAPATRLILDTVDLHHLREQREAELRGDHKLARLAAGTRRRELATITAADVTWVVSPVEAGLLGTSVPDSRVAVLPNLHEPDLAPAPFDGRSGLLFVGGARHPPNVDAARWLLTEIAPRVHAQLPHCELHLVGEGLPQALASEAGSAMVRIHGHVPDLAPLLSGCRVGVAPLRFGAGVKGKVNLCMAAGMPVVATGCAVEGMHVEDGRDALVADDAAAFARAIVRLHGDAALWARLSAAGLDNVRRHFSFEAARATIAASLPPVSP